MSKAPPFFRTPYNYNIEAESDVTGLLCEDDSLAQQHFKDEADINEIVRRFGLTGEMPANPHLPVSGDFTAVTDYQTALNAVMAAQEGFMALPPDLRSRFYNDPQKLLVFLEDPSNHAEAVRLGLVNPPPAPPAPAAP